MHLAEIHRCSLHRYDGAVGHIRSIDGCKVISIDVQFVIFSICRGRTVEVPVGMIGHVNDGFLVGCCRILNINGVVIGKGISYNGRHVAREVIVFIGRMQRKFERIGRRLAAIVNLILPSSEAAVQAMAIVVFRQLDGFTVNCDAPLVDTVGISPNGCAEITAKMLVVGILSHIVVAQTHIVKLALTVGNHHGNDARSKVCHAQFYAVFVRQRVETGLLSANIRLEIRGVKPALCHFPACLYHWCGSHLRGHIALNIRPAVNPVNPVHPHQTPCMGVVNLETVVQ